MAKKYQLKNGMNVLLVESHKSPVVSIQVWVNTGSADEGKGEEGISHFIEHLVFKGTRNYQVGEIASKIEGSGGELNAYTSFDQTVFYVTISKHFIDIGLDALSEMMGYPLFDQEEIDNEREVVIEEIKQTNDSPQRQASRLLFSTMYKKHPYGIPVIGYDKVIKKVSRKKLVDYYQRRYSPKNMTLVITGDFESKELRKQVQSYFGEIPAFPLKRKARIKQETQEKPRIKVKSGDFKESYLYLAWKTPSAKHADVAALDVLALILGQGESSRLMKRLRIERPLTNYAVASTFTPKDPGFFAISSSLDDKNLEETLQGINEELELVLSQLPADDELSKAIINMESDELYSLETVEGMSRKYGTFEHLFGDYKKQKEFLKQIQTLRPEDILRVARKYLKPEKLTITMLTPADEKEIKKPLNKFVKAYQKQYLTSKKVKAEKKKYSRPKGVKWTFTPHATEAKAKKVDVAKGTPLILRPTYDTPIVSVRTAFLGGLRQEKQEKGGVNELLSRVWTTGTKAMNEEQINVKVDELASSIGAFSGRNTAGLGMTSLAPFADEMLDLYVDCLERNEISEEAVEREKMIMLHQIKTRKDSPAQVAVLKMMEELFVGHPYSKDPLGSAESVSALTKEDVIVHQKVMTSKANCTMAVSGNFKVDEWSKKIEKALSGLGTNPKIDDRYTFTPPKEDKRIFQEMDKEQTHIVVAYPGLTFNSDDRYSLQLMQSVLAGQGGRLFIELRDKESLAYSVSPLRMEGIDAGYFGAYIACSPDKAEKSLSMIDQELVKLCKQPVTNDELERSKRYLIGRHDIDLQRVSAANASMLFDEIYGVPFDETFHFSERIQSITADDVMKVSNRIFSQPAVFSVVGRQNPW